MNFTLRQLHYFDALARARHFGRAAALVHISQPALSAQIKELERNLGADLVERQNREVILTPFGRAVLDHARRILAEGRDLDRVVRGWGGLGGTLRLGVIPTIAPYILPSLLERLRSQDVSMQVLVFERKTATLITDLADGTIDAALLALPVETPGMTALPLFEDRFLLAGTPAQIARLGSAETLRPTGVPQSALLLLDEGHCLSEQALDVCGRSGDGGQIDMAVSSLPTLTRLVAAGFGLTLMPELAAPTECGKDSGIVLHRFATPEPARQIALVRRETAADAAWFADLAQAVSAAGEQILGTARKLWPL